MTEYTRIRVLHSPTVLRTDDMITLSSKVCFILTSQPCSICFTNNSCHLILPSLSEGKVW